MNELINTTDGLLDAVRSNDAVANVWDHMILGGYIGSHAHNTTDEATDDIDFMGIYVAPKEHYLGLSKAKPVHNPRVMDKYDFTMYELRHFVRLLLKGAPNAISMLFLPEDCTVIKNCWGRRLFQNRHMFLSKCLFKTFGGFARSHLDKMMTPCTNAAFQGSKRRQRFEKFGYDCKNASHLIRIMRMGVEVLRTGYMSVRRADAAELVAIKNGEWTIDQVRHAHRSLEQQFNQAIETTSLPDQPDVKGAEELLVLILGTALNVR